jgi:hypothetical protein
MPEAEFFFTNGHAAAPPGYGFFEFARNSFSEVVGHCFNLLRIIVSTYKMAILRLQSVLNCFGHGVMECWSAGVLKKMICSSTHYSKTPVL